MCKAKECIQSFKSENHKKATQTVQEPKKDNIIVDLLRLEVLE
jgi:hypothetical protein